MKKIGRVSKFSPYQGFFVKKLFLFFIASTLAAETFFTDCTQSAVFLATPCLSWDLELNLLYLRPNCSTFPYAIEIDHSHWKAHSVHPHYSLGYEFGASAFLQDRSGELNVNYTHFNSDKTSRSKGLLIDCDLLFTHAKGHLSHHFDAGNITYGILINGGSCLKANFFAGVGLVRLDQKAKTAFSSTSSSRKVHTCSNFFGAGPQLGFDFSYGLTKGFQILGRARSTLYVGRIKNHTHAVHEHYCQLVVPGIEGKAAIAYTFWLGDCICSFIGGYQVLYYWNAVQTLESNFRKSYTHFALSGPYSAFDVAF